MHLKKNQLLDDLRITLKEDQDKTISIIYGGYGDFIALDFFLSEYEKDSIKIIYQLGYRPEMYKDFFLNYRNVEKYVYFWNCLGSKDATKESRNVIMNEFKQSNLNYKIINSTVLENLNVRSKYVQNSTYIKQNQANIDNFELPDKFISVCPYTINATEKWKCRKLSKIEWEDLIKLTELVNVKIVILGIDCEVPKHKNIIDLNNKTTIHESIEITKKSVAYIGVDSILSVIAAYSKLSLVKSIRDIGAAIDNKDFYYPNGCRFVENLTFENMKKIFNKFIPI